MTGINILEASFSDFVVACRLDYQALKHGKRVDDLVGLTDEELQGLQYQKGGLLKEPKLIWKILSRTIMSDAIEPDDTTGLVSLNSRVRLNIVEWMVTLMKDNRRDESSPLVFQPYIMALVLLKLPDFSGMLDTKHPNYKVVNLTGRSREGIVFCRLELIQLSFTLWHMTIFFGFIYILTCIAFSAIEPILCPGNIF
jgi:hypothetical protein